MERKFVNKSFATQSSGFGQPLVNQPRFNGQPIQHSNHRVAALLPNPNTPPLRTPNYNRNKKNFINNNNNNNSNLSQAQSFSSQPRQKVSSNSDNRINHKFDIIRKPQIRRPKINTKIEIDSKSSVIQVQQDLPPNVVLSVTNYPSSCNEAALIMFFAKMNGFLQLVSHRTKKNISFVIYNTVDQAKDALSVYHGYQMDHDHKLQVCYSNHENAYGD